MVRAGAAAAADSRLLSNLLAAEKEYIKALSTLLNASHHSHASLSAYASASPPSTSAALVSFANTLGVADEALRAYAHAVEGWMDDMRNLKDLEDEVGEIMRDREILVTRLIKQSKVKPGLEAQAQLGSSLNSPGPANPKLVAAQEELQGCLQVLQQKDAELDSKRHDVLTIGFAVRARAMARCGRVWDRAGEDAAKIFDIIGERPLSPDKPLPIPDHTAVLLRPDPTRRSSDVSSVTPSQSASQILLSSSQEHLPAPPAKSASTGRHPLSRRITEESLQDTRKSISRRESSSSSDEDVAGMKVVENERFSRVNLRQPIAVGDESEPEQLPSRSFVQPPQGSPAKKKGFFGSLKGLFKSNPSSSSNLSNVSAPTYLGGGPVQKRKSLFGEGRNDWQTRTDRNVRTIHKHQEPDVMSDVGPRSPTKKRLRRHQRQNGSSDDEQNSTAAWAASQSNEALASNRQYTKPKAENPTPKLGRNNSITSAASAPPAITPVRTSNKARRAATTKANTLGNAASASSTDVRRSTSAASSKKSSKRPASLHAPATGPSLMSIVEDAARARQTNSSSTFLVSSGPIAIPKAPPRVSRAALETVDARKRVSSIESKNSAFLAPPPASVPQRKGSSASSRSPSPGKSALRSAMRTSPQIPPTLNLPEVVAPPPNLRRNDSVNSKISQSSYETGREDFDEEEDEAGNASDAPTETGPTLPEKEEGVQRRKSVRMSLNPTYAATPPAFDDSASESHAPWGSPAKQNSAKHNGKATTKDVWQDSSEEDEEYQNARALLTRAAGK